MADEQRVFLAYRAIFDGNNAQIRQSKAISKVVSQHRKSSRALLRGLEDKYIVGILKNLSERRSFESEVEAKLAFPNLFTTTLAQNAQHDTLEADAARSEAEALENVVSLEEVIDRGLNKTIDELSPEISTATTGSKTTEDLKVPSLYPISISYKTQHFILTNTQRLLEECCYDFTLKCLPEILEQRQWDCPEAIELNKWISVVVKRLGKLPAGCFETSIENPATTLASMLAPISKVRHSAVHRLPTTAKGISEMIRCAIQFAKILRSSACEQQLHKLNHELEGKIHALELNKNFLEAKFEGEMRDIARQRRELEDKEKEALSIMLREDEDYSSLIGTLLSQGVAEIL